LPCVYWRSGWKMMKLHLFRSAWSSPCLHEPVAIVEGQEPHCWQSAGRLSAKPDRTAPWPGTDGLTLCLHSTRVKSWARQFWRVSQSAPDFAPATSESRAGRPPLAAHLPPGRRQSAVPAVACFRVRFTRKVPCDNPTYPQITCCVKSFSGLY
jgi:hypothetical protein